MAYIKQTWQCGDVVSAEKLNHMEEGIEECCGGGGAEPLIVRIDHLEGSFPNQYPVFDKTWNDVDNALAEGRYVVSIAPSANGTIQSLFFGTSREVLDEVLGTYQYTASALYPSYPSATSIGTQTAYADSKDGYLQGRPFTEM